jgi:hypothetical protein
MYDIFISYCHDDNEKLFNEKLGWVEIFQDTLKKRLAVYAGRDELPSVFWDNRDIQINNVLDETIEQALRETAVLVSVLSPSYVSSAWCKQEIQLFCSAAASSRYGSLRADEDKVSRIVKILKLRVANESSLAAIPELRDCTGLAFYEEKDGFIAEINPQRDATDWNAFVDLINKLAQVLLKTLGVVDKRSRTGLTIYLADGSLDLGEDRELLAREFDAWGHTVVREAAPERNCDLQTYRERVRRNVERCHLSIHPVGMTYGTRPDGWSGKSTVEVQYDVAGEEMQRGDREFALLRLPWMKSDLQPEEAAQQEFVSKIRTDPALFKETLEGLKTRVRDLLAPLLVPKAPVTDTSAPVAAPAAVEKPGVYIVCDQNDSPEKLSALEALLSPHYAVTRSFLKSEVLELGAKRAPNELDALVRQDHLDNLKTCDAVLIYYGEGDLLWLRIKLRELNSAAQLGRITPFRARAVFVASGDKQSYDNPDVLVLRAFDDPALALAPLDAALRTARQQAV